MTDPDTPTPHDGQDATQDAEPVRRDFLTLLTLATASVGACAFAWPFLDSLGPANPGDPADAVVEVDLTKLAPGQQMVVVWRGHPVFVVHRTEQELHALQDAALLHDLRDPGSAELQQPDYAHNWHRSVVPEIGVLVGVCTHLGCVPRFRPGAPGAGGGGGSAIAEAGGYGCPCHGSRFDLAGRVFTGAPAPYNLPVPPHSLPHPALLRIGVDPDGSSFDFDSIRQI